MHMHWWQSIRWQLAIGSVLVAFFATILLALTVILAVIYYYDVDQREQLTRIATASAQRIGTSYAQSSNLFQAATGTLPLEYTHNLQGEDYLIIVLNRNNLPVYPRVLTAQRSARLALLLAAADPSLQKIDYRRIRQAIVKGQKGVVSTDEIGTSRPITTRSFVVQPIVIGGDSKAPVVGVLFITPRSAVENTLPPFVATISQSVLLASVLVAFVAMLAAILFSRTLTRPLAKLTNTARVLAEGDYRARVEINQQGELGELATTFNEMAARLAHDVNELHQQERWRRELLMNITHDLATPLTAIAGLGESLMDGVNHQREDYEATGQIIVRETLRLRRLVQDLHVMTKVESRAIQPERTFVRLATLVDDMLAVLTPEFERAHVEPCNAITYDLPLVLADPDMLTRVFSNLCDNAIRHTPTDSMVLIEAFQQNNQLIVSVTDSGEGIPAEALPRVFDRFYRVDTSRHMTTGGSGLGLAIVRAIVEAHEGTIWAENVPTGGARFVFTLPVAGA